MWKSDAFFIAFLSKCTSNVDRLAFKTKTACCHGNKDRSEENFKDIVKLADTETQKVSRQFPQSGVINIRNALETMRHTITVTQLQRL